MSMCTRYYMGCLCVYLAISIFVILHNKKQSNDITGRHRSELSILYIDDMLDMLDIEILLLGDILIMGNVI